MNEELLISLVQKYPELYNPEHLNYQDEQRAINIWEEIAEIMNETPLTCKDRWKRIRDTFKRAYLSKVSKRGPTIKNAKPIRFSSELSFLLPYLANELEKMAKHQEISENEERSNTTESITSAAVAAPGKVSDKKRKLEEVTQSMSQSLSEKRCCCDREEEEDPTVFFFKSLGKTVKTFPSDLKIRVKRAVFGIVSEAEEEFIKRNDTVQSTFVCKQEPI